MPQISIIMPALNEEENVGSAIESSLKVFDDYDIHGEIVVVNDGSTDRTQEIIEQYSRKDPRVRFLKHDSPHGFGGSFWDGVDNARGETVVCLPGDNENDPWEILRYFHLTEHVDIVIPFIFNKTVRSFYRNTLSFIYRFIVNTTFGTNLNYTNGTVLYRKAVLKELEYRSHSFFFQTDILIRLIRRGYLFAEVPQRLDVRESGESKALSFPSLIQVIKGYMKLMKDLNLGNKKENRVLSQGTVSSLRTEANGK